MICKNCGGKIEKDDLVCPYCGYENFEQAVEEQEEFVDNYSKMTKEVKKKPEKAAKKAGKIIILMVLLAIILFAIVLAVAFIIRKSGGEDKKVEEYKQHIEILEQYYVDDDYKKMFTYMEGLDDNHYSVYEKYSIACDLYDDYLFAKDCTVDAVDIYGEYKGDPEVLSFYIRLNCQNLNDIKLLRENEYEYEEKKAAEYFEKKNRETMKKYLLMNDEEIEECLEIYTGEDEVYIEIAEILLDRMYKGE